MKPPRVTSSRVVYENRWMRLHEDRLERMITDGRIADAAAVAAWHRVVTTR